jgi:hypothetical protein
VGGLLWCKIPSGDRGEEYESSSFFLKKIVQGWRKTMLKIKDKDLLKEYTIVEFNRSLLREVVKIRPDLILDLGPMDGSTLITLMKWYTPGIKGTCGKR